MHNRSYTRRKQNIQFGIKHVHHHNSLTVNMIAKQISQEYLSYENCLATSYVAATFHPTIGQHAYQYFSNTATPKLAMIPQGIRVKTCLHIAKIHKSAKPT